MKKYYKIHFHSNEELYVTASSMDRIALWVLQNRPISHYYLMNIIEVNADKSRKENNDFMMLPGSEYFHYEEVYGNISDEEIRQIEIERYKDYILNGHKFNEDWY